MGRNEKRAYLIEIRGRYRQSDRKTKSKILDEFCEVCGYNRKYALRLINKPPNSPKKKPGPKPIYVPSELLEHLKRIWFASDQMCGKRLKAIIPEWLPHYESEYGQLTTKQRVLLLQMSPATIDRLLEPLRSTNKRKGLSGTKPGTLLKSQIPILNNQWNESLPGFMEADTVAHCGNSLAGDFVWSLTMTDISSGWTECRATWNKGSAGVLEQIKHIEMSLPFELKGFDCDNGSEFLNYHLLRYFAKRKQPIQFTRSRPYHKNDNAHVEQKNWTHVRQLFGYDRFQSAKLVSLMNDLYTNEWCTLQNHFCPLSKLIEKKRVNSKYVKRFDPYQTPYQRFMLSEHVSIEAKQKLKQVHGKLNPFQLRKTIEMKLKEIFKLVEISSMGRRRI